MGRKKVIEIETTEKKIRRKRLNAKREGLVRKPPYEQFSKITHYGQLFRQLREYAFYTRQELAFITGVDVVTITNFEEGLHDVGFDKVRAMVECLGLKISITFAGLNDVDLGRFAHLLYRGNLLAEHFAAFARHRREINCDYPSYRELYKKFERSWKENPGPPKDDEVQDIPRSGYAADLENDNGDFMNESEEDLWDLSKW